MQIKLERKNMTKRYWHWINGDKLRDGTKAVVGEWTVRVDDIKLCVKGYHGSYNVLDALKYAPGNTICRVYIKEVLESEDKVVGTQRKIIWMADAKEVLVQFAKWCALQVIDLWDAPDVVVEFLNSSYTDADAAHTIRAAAGYTIHTAAAHASAASAYAAAHASAASAYAAAHAAATHASYAHAAAYAAAIEDMKIRQNSMKIRQNKQLTDMLRKLEREKKRND
jgi:hypothetical protein